MKHCLQTDLEFFKLVMNYFIHNDVNIMLLKGSIYTTNVSKNLEISFRLNDTIADDPKIEMAIKHDENVSFIYYKFNKPLYDILYSIVNDIVLISHRYDGEIDNCWKVMRKHLENEIED